MKGRVIFRKAVVIFNIIFYEFYEGNKTVPGKVAATHTEDGHKQDT